MSTGIGALWLIHQVALADRIFGESPLAALGASQSGNRLDTDGLQLTMNIIQNGLMASPSVCMTSCSLFR